MAPRLCCCGVSCRLGEDDFDRADSADPGPKWKIITGTGAIVGNKIEVNGRVATTICHPPAATNGSWIANFTLVNLRTQSLFEVGVGDPNSSTYAVKFEPSGIDTAGAKIKVTVIGTTTETFDFLWPVGVGGLSANTLGAKICYEPGAILSASIAAPTVDTCIPAGGAACYVAAGTNVGGFFWKRGHFDNWTYDQTILDNFDCEPCGCFCFKRVGATKDFSCYPKTLHLNFALVSGTCSELDGLSIAMVQGNLSPGDGHPQKKSWYSAVQSCAGNEYAFVLDCTSITKDGTNWFQSLSLRLTDNNYTNSTVLFNWVTPSINLSTRDADFATSTCSPLSLEFPGLKVNSFFGPCPPPAPPGALGHYIFCCPSNGCSGTAQYVELDLTVTL